MSPEFDFSAYLEKMGVAQPNGDIHLPGGIVVRDPLRTFSCEGCTQNTTRRVPVFKEGQLFRVANLCKTCHDKKVEAAERRRGRQARTQAEPASTSVRVSSTGSTLDDIDALLAECS